MSDFAPTGRPMGRIPKPELRMIRDNVLFTPTQYSYIRTNAEQRNLSVSAVVREMIDAWLAAHPLPTE